MFHYKYTLLKLSIIICIYIIALGCNKSGGLTIDSNNILRWQAPGLCNDNKTKLDGIEGKITGFNIYYKAVNSYNECNVALFNSLYGQLKPLRINADLSEISLTELQASIINFEINRHICITMTTIADIGSDIIGAESDYADPPAFK